MLGEILINKGYFVLTIQWNTLNELALSVHGRQVGVNNIFNGARTTHFPITSHGGPVMSTPSKLLHTLKP